MRRVVRAVFLVSVLMLPLAACTDVPTFDPTDMFDHDFFNTKKPLPGQRQEVFPDGTPGVPHGVPPELVRGYQPPAEPPADPVIQAGLPREEAPPKPKVKPKPKPKSDLVAVPQGHPTAVTVRPPGQSAQPGTPWPDAPAQSQQQAPGGGGVQWPDPPATH
jgi:hypothetical protein